MSEVKTAEQKHATDKKAEQPRKRRFDGRSDQEKSRIITKDNAKGLVRLRAQTSKSGPEYQCGNCKCNRYSPCGCTKGKKK